jgi:hypothetical protein
VARNERVFQYPTVIGLRLMPEDRAKLAYLVDQCGRPQAELLRLLIRAAQPVDVPPVKFATAAQET